MTLYKYELFKIFSRKSIYACLVLFIALYALSHSSTRGNVAGVSYSLYEQWGGEVTPAKVLLARKALDDQGKDYEKRYQANARSGVGNALTDTTDLEKRQAQVYQDVINAGHRLQKHTDMIAELKRDLSELKNNKNSGFELKEKQLHLNMLASLDPPRVSYKKGWTDSIDFINTLGLIFIGGLLLLGLSSVFASEYSSKMHELILSSRYGKTKLVTTKILAGLSFTLLITGVFEVINLATNYNVFGLSGGTSPLQDISKYNYSPFSLNLGQYHAIQLATQFIGAFAFGLFILLMSVLFKNTITTIFVAGTTFSIPIVLKNFLYITSGLAKLLIDYSYTQVIRVEGLFSSFKVVNIIGFPVHYHMVLILLVLLTSLIISKQIYRIFRISHTA